MITLSVFFSGFFLGVLASICIHLVLTDFKKHDNM